jgi:putative membrane protein
MSKPYKRFKPEELTLRDELALDRTLLANERTLLAYLRSGVTLILAGVTFIHFAQEQWFKIIGALCLPAGVIFMLFGGVRYRIMSSDIAATRKQIDTKGTTMHESNAKQVVKATERDDG